MESDGRRVHIVPALDGALYQNDGMTFHPLMTDADQLLEKSARLAPDLFVAGSKRV